MRRSLVCGLVAFACLFSIGNSDDGLWRDIRGPAHQALLENFKNSNTPLPLIRNGKPQLLAASPPLESPALVAGIIAERLPPLPALAPIPPSIGHLADVDVTFSDGIARNILTFAQNLSNQINSNYHKTTIFSPLSIMSALALLLLGAKGRSYTELATLFGTNDMVKLHDQFGLMLQDVQQSVKENTSPLRQLDAWHSNSVRRSLRNYSRRPIAPPEVRVANGLFIQHGYSLNPDYRQAMVDIYKADVLTFDFAKSPASAKYNINSWVEQHTRGKIQNILVEDLEPETRIIMANTLYFKAMWEIDFINGATKVEDFYPNGEGTQPVVPVEMMVGAGAFPYYEDVQFNCRIIGLPYHGNLTTMYVIQPIRSSVAELANLQQRLTADIIENLISQMTRRSVIIAFPKLHIVDSFKLHSLLQRMNIGGIFNPVQSDLSLIGTNEAPVAQSATAGRGHIDRLSSLQNLVSQRQAAMASQVPTPPSDLIVSDILHKVDFVVNEQGTEAAAATAAVLKKSGPEIIFRGETPFIVLVRHDLTKLPLFYGMINEPPAAKSSSSSSQ